MKMLFMKKILTLNLKNRCVYYLTFLKFWSPSLTRGVDPNILSGDIVRYPFCMAYRLDMIRSRSEHFFTGRKRDLGT